MSAQAIANGSAWLTKLMGPPPASLRVASRHLLWLGLALGLGAFGLVYFFGAEPLRDRIAERPLVWVAMAGAFGLALAVLLLKLSALLRLRFATTELLDFKKLRAATAPERLIRPERAAATVQALSEGTNPVLKRRLFHALRLLHEYRDPHLAKHALRQESKLDQLAAERSTASVRTFGVVLLVFGLLGTLVALVAPTPSFTAAHGDLTSWAVLEPTLFAVLGLIVLTLVAMAVRAWEGHTLLQIDRVAWEQVAPRLAPSLADEEAAKESTPPAAIVLPFGANESGASRAGEGGSAAQEAAGIDTKDTRSEEETTLDEEAPAAAEEGPALQRQREQVERFLVMPGEADPASPPAAPSAAEARMAGEGRSSAAMPMPAIHEPSRRARTDARDDLGDGADDAWQEEESSAPLPGEGDDAFATQIVMSYDELRPTEPQNIILYGPPGTGKTYGTVRRALELILGKEKVRDLDDREVLALFREYQAAGQIEFVTFHQAYGYEEFIEGIRPVLEQQGSDAEVRYELHDGVFKRLALRAAGEGLGPLGGRLDFDTLWESLLRELGRAKEAVVVTDDDDTHYAVNAGPNELVYFQPCELDEQGKATNLSSRGLVASQENARIVWKHRKRLGEEPTPEDVERVLATEQLVDSGNDPTALRLVYGLLRPLVEDPTVRKRALDHRLPHVQRTLNRLGPSSNFRFTNETPQYVLIIDEINRGNISKILGDLITLLEADKRLTARNELKLPLAYTPQHKFSVPPNLHIIGTMNTADRSIALMDVALRRRFTFEEVMPSVAVVRNILSRKGLDTAFVDMVCELFATINGRIRLLFDPDHQLGHSFFLNVHNVEELRRVFLDRIVPTLQEYFYGAWNKICMVLGCPYDEWGEPARQAPHLTPVRDGRRVYAYPMVTANVFAEVKALGFDLEDYENRIDYQLQPEFEKGLLSEEDLTATFLAVLTLEPNEFRQRLARLTGTSGAESETG